MKYVAWLWRNLRGFRRNICVRVVCGSLQVALGLLMVWLSKRFIDETIRTGSSSDVVSMVALLALTVVGGIVIRQLYFYLSASANIVKTNQLRLEIFSGLFSRQLFSDRDLHSGDVSSRLSKDIDAIGDVTMVTIPQMIVTAIQLTASFSLMRFFDARLAWALVLFTPVAIILGKLVSRKLRQMTLEIREGESRIQMHVQEAVEHNAVLRSLGSELWVTGRLDSFQRKLKGTVLKRTRFTMVTRFMLSCGFGLGYLMAFVWGGIGLRNGTITFGVMTSFLQLVGMIQSPILSLLNMIPQVIHATASIDRLEELRCASETADLSTGPLVENAGVRVENVSFRYADEDRQILDGFSHDFKPGTKTALMGETGAGKTTLFRLMLGFVKANSGDLQIYSGPDVNLSMLPVDEHTRNNFVFVPQGNTLMSGSIRYNLQLAKPDVTEDEMRHVLHSACADFVYDLPNGIDTELGERGKGLSEGQAQRIAIARGLLRNGSIFLLDEISSALDEDTERELFRRLFESYSQKTMILITHRVAACALCDEIVRI